MPQFLRELRERISHVIASADESQVRSTWEAFEYRFDVSGVTNGAYTEHHQIYIMSFHAVFKLFRVCICNRFENTLIYYHPNNLRRLCVVKARRQSTKINTHRQPRVCIYVNILYV
jgi:hypothetical protein